MSFIEQIFKSLYDKQFFTPGSKLFLGSLVKEPFRAPDILEQDLGKPLAGGCAQGKPVGNAVLDLRDQAISGLSSIAKNGNYSSSSTVDYTQFIVPAKFSSQNLPQRQSDFIEINKKINECPFVGTPGKFCDEKECAGCLTGFPVCGPLTADAAGLTGYTGLKNTGTFVCHQQCSEGCPVDPMGKYIFTLNNVTMTITIQFYIPSDTSQPMYIKVPSLTVDPVQAEDMTLTLLHEDGSLPRYNMNDIGTDQTEVSYWFAQQAINFPLKKDDSAMKNIMDTINQYISQYINDQQQNVSIRRSIEDPVNEYLKKY